MSFDTFVNETLVIEKAETLLQESAEDQNYFIAYEHLLTDYKKLLKTSRRIVRISDRNEEGLITARNQIQQQQTSLEQAHQELKRLSEQRLRTIVEATPIAIVIRSVEDGVIIYANAIAGPMLGLATEQLLGRKVTDFYADPCEKEKLLEILKRDGQIDHYELQIRKSDGSILWTDISERHLVFNEQPCVLAACNDITHLKQLNQAASRFVPIEFLSFLEKKSIVNIHLGDHITDEMTVMFTDLRSFTTLSEGMSPQENFDFLNAYLGHVSPIVRQFNGFIVKYLGDGIMAIFPESADDGVQAGIEKLNQVQSFNKDRDKPGRLPIQVGIGVNTGHIMVGMIGEAGRIQGDVISDNVNLTSRIENLTKFYSVSFIISAATKAALKDPAKYKIRFLDRVQVMGRLKSLDLYEVYDSDSPKMLALKQETHEQYQEAMEYYFARDFVKAQTLLFKVLQKNPDDKVAWHHLIKTTECREHGVPDSWAGVTVMANK